MTVLARLPFFYGWVVLASSFTILAVAYTVRYGYSVFFVAILEEFGWSRALTAGAYSISVLIYGITGPLAGLLIDRWGPRVVMSVGALLLAAGMVGCSFTTEPWHLYVFYGLFASLGMNLAGWVPAVAIMQNWFVRRLGLVLGIAAAGIGFGMLALVPLCQSIILQLGWRSAFLAVAAMVLVVLLPSAAFLQRKRPQDLGLQPDGGNSSPAETRQQQDSLVVDEAWARRDWTPRAALSNGRFWLAALCYFAICFATQMPLVHHVALLVDSGYDKMLAASAVSMVGIASVVGKLTWGLASDRYGREVTFTISLGFAAVGIALLIVARGAPIAWLPYAYGIWMGLGYATMAPAASFIADLFRGKSFGTIFGILSGAGGIGTSLGSWVAGYIFDVSGDYLLALLLAEGALVLAVVALWLTAPRKVRLVPGQAAKMRRSATPPAPEQATRA
ncbi:MAG: MFS transporter [Chloroflexota bacterium]